MAYGDNIRGQVDRSFGAVQVTGFGIAAAMGIGSAVIIDLVQQQEASALYVINRWILEVTSLLGIQAIPLYGVMLILMGIGAATVIFSQPLNMRTAFAQGFGALAILVTIAPSDLGAPLDAPAETTQMQTDDNFDLMFEETSLRPDLGDGVIMVPVTMQRSAAEEAYQLRIQVKFPEGLPMDFQKMLRNNRLVGKLYNSETNTKYNIFRNSGAEMSYRDNTLRIVTQVSATTPEAELWLLIEAQGYRIQEESFVAQRGANPIWNVEMQESSTPLLMQRLAHSYRF